jgi:hypothetical protein
MVVDFAKLTGWNGWTLHVTGLWQFGGNLGADIGVLANPSGLVSAHATRLDSFWLQQALFNNHIFIRAGQFAGLDFYGEQEYGASFLIEPLDYAHGNLFSNTFESFNPAGAPVAEIRIVPWRTFYIKSAVLWQPQSLPAGSQPFPLPNQQYSGLGFGDRLHTQLARHVRALAPSESINLSRQLQVWRGLQPRQVRQCCGSSKQRQLLDLRGSKPGLVPNGVRFKLRPRCHARL